MAVSISFGLVYAYAQTQSLALLTFIGMGTAPVLAQAAVLCLIAMASVASIFFIGREIIRYFSNNGNGGPGGGGAGAAAAYVPEENRGYFGVPSLFSNSEYEVPYAQPVNNSESGILNSFAALVAQPVSILSSLGGSPNESGDPMSNASAPPAYAVGAG